MGKVIYPKVTKLVRVSQSGDFAVSFTKHKYQQVALWARKTLRVYEDYNNGKWVYLTLSAKDELEAVMRFRKLWAGLPKKEQD